MSTRNSLLLACLLSAPATAEPYLEGWIGTIAADRTVTFAGAKLVDQGGDALSAGLRAGYGYRWQSGLYAAGEADVWQSDGRSRINTAGLFDSRRWMGGVGVYGRLGYSPQPGTVIYGRAGWQAWDAVAEQPNGASNAADFTTFAIGAGAQVALGRRWYGRIDFTYANQTILDEMYQASIAVGVRF